MNASKQALRGLCVREMEELCLTCTVFGRAFVPGGQVWDEFCGYLFVLLEAMVPCTADIVQTALLAFAWLGRAHRVQCTEGLRRLASEDQYESQFSQKSWL